MTLLILLSSFLSFGKLADTTNHSSVELHAILSDLEATTFWLSRLQYGAIPLDNAGIVAIVRNGKNYNLKKKYDWKYQVLIARSTDIFPKVLYILCLLAPTNNEF